MIFPRYRVIGKDGRPVIDASTQRPWIGYRHMAEHVAFLWRDRNARLEEVTTEFDASKPYFIIAGHPMHAMCIHSGPAPRTETGGRHPVPIHFCADEVPLAEKVFRSDDGRVVVRLVGVCHFCGRQFCTEPVEE
jgi:hypothetical protein